MHKTENIYYISYMESSSIRSVRKISSPRLLEPASNKKIKRIFHIKSLPAYDYESIRKASTSKIESLFKESPQVKLRRFKTQQNLKPPFFGAVKTARDRNAEWGKKKEQNSQPSQISKSVTKSTNFKSPEKDMPRKCSKVEKTRSKKGGKKVFSGILKRVKEVMEEYQIRFEKCMEEKDLILKENDRLKNQIEHLQRKTKRSQK